VLVRPVEENAPDQTAIDGWQILAITRRQREHHLARSAAWGGGRCRGNDRGLRQRRRQARRSGARARGWRQRNRRTGVWDGLRRHRRRAVTEKLSLRGKSERGEQNPRKCERRPQLDAAPPSEDAVTPYTHVPAFH